jgi:hypothetical protein
LLPVACARPAPPPRVAPVDAGAVARSITLCTTTEGELRRQLGQPTRDGLLRRSRVLSWIVGEDQVVTYLAVLLNERGVVVDLYWDLPTEIPWVPTDQCR